MAWQRFRRYATNRGTLGSLAVFGALVLGAPGAAAQTLAVSGNPGLLRVNTAVAGSQPLSVSNATTTYTVTTPNPSRLYKITAMLDTPMPLGTTLTATFAAPPTATSLGAVALDNTARDVVVNIRRNTNSTRGITYDFTATTAAGVLMTSTRIVTLTLVQMP